MPVSGPAAGVHLVPLLVALLITVAAYHTAVPGGFVYDDDVQVVGNPYVREGGLFWRAMGDDVWGFKGDDAGAWSNYWRPAFVLWLVVNHRLFGFDPAGWHVAGILLQCVVIVLGAAVLRRLEIPPPVSAATLWVFAAHPLQVESVAWVSGSPNLLLGAFVLGSYVAYLAHRSRPRYVLAAVSLLLYAGAMLSKEVGILLPLLIAAGEWARPGRQRLKRGLRAALPYLPVAAVWMLLRYLVLGAVLQPSPEGPGVSSVVLSVPRFFVFYLRQAFWPLNLSPVHSLHPLEPGELGLTSFVLPLLVLVGALSGSLWLWRRAPRCRMGVVLAPLFLAPAFNVGILSPERMAQDRYLYLPLFGIALLTFGALWELALKLLSERAAGGVFYAAGLALSVVLGLTTAGYNRVWASDIALWEHAVERYPRSTFALSSLGYHYRTDGRTAEAQEVLLRAVELDPGTARAWVDLGIIATNEGRLGDAESSFSRALSIDPDHEVAREHLGVALIAQDRLQEALAVFREAERRRPDLKVRHILNIAVIQERINRPDQALLGLESIADEMAGSTDPATLRGYVQLGELYRRAGRVDEARRAFRTYLEKTEGLRDPRFDGLRETARRRLALLEPDDGDRIRNLKE